MCSVWSDSLLSLSPSHLYDIVSLPHTPNPQKKKKKRPSLHCTSGFFSCKSWPLLHCRICEVRLYSWRIPVFTGTLYRVVTQEALISHWLNERIWVLFLLIICGLRLFVLVLSQWKITKEFTDFIIKSLNSKSNRSKHISLAHYEETVAYR